MRAGRVITTALAVLFAASSAVAQDVRAPHLRPTDLSSDEAGIWYAADKAETEAKNSGDLDGDAALTAYVKGVECKVAPEYCGDVRVYVMDRPFFNAMTAPNGYIEVWTGSLLRVRDEAELAFILGHETTHFALNHSLLAHRALQDRLNAVLPIGILAAPFAGGLVLALGYLGVAASFQHFSREQEFAADRGGLDRISTAGYDPQAAVSIWRGLIDEQSHSEFEKVREAHSGAGIFDDHPLVGDRLDALTALAKGKPSGDQGRDRFRAIIRPHLAALLREDLRRRDFGETLFVIERLSSDGQDLGVLNYFRGECLRQRHGDGDLAQATSAYETAAAATDAPPEAWRELGDLYRTQGKSQQASTAYRAYLDHAPSAPDRWMIEDALSKLGS